MNKGPCWAILLPVKNLLLYTHTALLALLAGLCALFIAGVTPFGEVTLCWQDNGQQVASDFGYVRGVWEGRHSLDWSYACGGSPRSSFHPTFNNLCSPLTWAVAALPGISAVTGLSLLFLLQLTLLPLGALFYLRRRFPRLPGLLSVALALASAFGGFVLSKHTFLPFLHVALLFPWYLAALDSLLRRGRWLPYTLLLGYMLAVGTYFAWMWLLFTAVYASARTGWRWNSPVRQHTLTLFLASAVALLLSSISWLPSFVVTLFSARAGEAHFWWNATRAELEPASLIHLLSLPAALCVLMLLFAWRRPRCSRYALTLAVLAVGLACVSASTLWHLSRPWDFAGRFGYMADFMLICVAAEAAQRRRRPWRYALPPALIFGTLLLASSFVMVQSESRRYQASADRLRIAEWAAEQIPQPRGRVKSRGYAAVENIAFFTPFDSLSHFTACITRSQEETLARWGYQQRAAVISSEGGTLATDTLLGIRYTLSQAGEGAPYRVEENPYYFGMGLMVPKGLFPLSAASADPIARQQELLAVLLGAEYAGTRSWASVNEPLPLEPGCLPYLQQPAEGEGFVMEGSPWLRWGGVEGAPRLQQLFPPCRWLGSRVGQGTLCELYHLPLASLQALRAYGQELPVSCRYAGRCMSITCRSTEARPMLFLPLLWQLNYKATVDGKPAEVEFLDGFVGIAMPAAGEHRVELHYEPVGRYTFLLPGIGLLVILLMSRRLPLGPTALALRGWGEKACRRLLLVVSLLLLLWPLLTLPVGLLWR